MSELEELVELLLYVKYHRGIQALGVLDGVTKIPARGSHSGGLEIVNTRAERQLQELEGDVQRIVANHKSRLKELTVTE